jgi:hypothetical protein
VVEETFVDADDGRATTLYIVRCTDGDEEDCNEGELRSMLLPMEDAADSALSVEQLLLASENV